MAFAHELYGGPPPSQPSPAAAALGVPNQGAPEMNPRTPNATGAKGLALQNPTFALVALLALAALLINFSVRFEVSG
ncbi:MAG: hypothetical protein M3P34_00255 [Actinomycetota bacterium]|nr:hypothetical protein [Actinomycetota bacterium]